MSNDGFSKLVPQGMAALGPVRFPAAEPPAAKSQAVPARDAWLIAAMECQRRLAPEFSDIRRVKSLSPDDFLHSHYAPCIPVVFEGIAEDWPARRLWTPAYLKALIGAARVQFQADRDADPDFELFKDRHIRDMPFHDYIDSVVSGATQNDAYITAYNSAANREALKPLGRDLGTLPYLTGPEGMPWIGPAGTFTPLHFDLTNNLIVQVAGRKRLHLLPPGEGAAVADTRHVFSAVFDLTDPRRRARYPAAGAARPYAVDLLPGDAIFIPFAWWHQVRALDFSVTLTYTNFLWPNEAHATFPGGPAGDAPA